MPRPVPTAVCAALVALALPGCGGDDPAPRARTAPAGAAAQTLTVKGQFSLRYPRSWRRLRATTGFVASLRRAAGDAQLDITRTDEPRRPLDRIEDELTERLERQLPNFKLLRSSTPEIAGRRSLSYTFVGTKQGQTQNLTIVPDGDRTYTLSSVHGANKDEAATEVAAIVRSFKPL